MIVGEVIFVLGQYLAHQILISSLNRESYDPYMNINAILQKFNFIDNKKISWISINMRRFKGKEHSFLLRSQTVVYISFHITILLLPLKSCTQICRKHLNFPFGEP